jgi:hypothetical protein
MNALPVVVADLATETLDGFAAALLDDPTAWPAGDATMPNEVAAAVNQVVRDNYRSLLARRIGPHIQAIATDMEVAIAEDGPLADLGHIWGVYVEGFDLEDYTTVAKAKDWDARVEALSELAGQRINGASAPAVLPDRINAYIASDPRLAALAVATKHGLAAPVPSTRYFVHPESNSFFTTEDGSHPGTDGFVEEVDKDEYDRFVAHATKPEVKAFSWDDEDEVTEADGALTAAATPQPGEVPPSVDAPAPIQVSDTRPTPLLFQMLEPIGVLATDVAAITGIDKATISNGRSGKRPWKGLTEKQAGALADELDARVEAARALSGRLRALDPAVVDGNTRQ